MIIKSFSGSVSSIKEGAKIALTNRLFVNGWNLGSHLREALALKDNKKLRKVDPSLIMIAIVDGKAVSCSMVVYGDVFQVFVRVKYRRRGIASKMYKKSMKILKRKIPLKMMIADKRAELFYKKVSESDKGFVCRDNPPSVLIEKLPASLD